jgi:hypothetical protein
MPVFGFLMPPLGVIIKRRERPYQGGFYMKKILLVGLIGLLMAGGLVLAGCANPCEIKTGDCIISVSINTITTGVSISEIAICSDSGCRVVKSLKGTLNGENIEFNPRCDCK